MRRILVLLALAGVSLSSGCILAGKQVYYAIKGSSGDIEVRQALTGPFNVYSRAEVARFSNQVGDKAPATVTAILESEIKRELMALHDDNKKPLFSAVTLADESAAGPAGTLVVRGYIAEYEEGSAAKATGFVGANKLVTEVDFVDKASGRVLLKATITGVRKTDIGRDEKDTAAGVGKGIAEAVEDNWTKVDEDYTKVVPREPKEE